MHAHFSTCFLSACERGVTGLNVVRLTLPHPAGPTTSCAYFPIPPPANAAAPPPLPLLLPLPRRAVNSRATPYRLRLSQHASNAETRRHFARVVRAAGARRSDLAYRLRLSKRRHSAGRGQNEQATLPHSGLPHSSRGSTGPRLQFRPSSGSLSTRLSHSFNLSFNQPASQWLINRAAAGMFSRRKQ
eukprot:366419-Chlamydomonas_euryale.AAC.6